MFSKPITELTYIDIDDLINVRKIREGYHLDFKLNFSNPDKAKNELAKDISAFANSGGGFLIIGVDDKTHHILGVEPFVNHKPIHEWLNQVLNSNIEPTVYYLDPKIIEIPESDKVIVVIQVLESHKKPHILIEGNRFFIRVNDSSKAANYQQIRDMFEFTRIRTDEFQAFLAKKNLLDEESEKFGQTLNSKRLYTEIDAYNKDLKPKIIFSLIPKFLNDEKVEIPFKEFYNWLQKNSIGHKPLKDRNLYFGNYNFEPQIDGIIFNHEDKNNLYSYFQVSMNGYVEAGLSRAFIETSDNSENTWQMNIYLTQILTYEMMFLEFARKFYEFIHYHDEILLQISFVNMLNMNPYGLHSKYDRRFTPYYYPKNKQHKNFKLLVRFTPKSIDDNLIVNITKKHSEKLCRAFGLDEDLCFVDNQLCLQRMNRFQI